MNRERDSKGRYLKTHGMKNSKVYNIWCAMKERCNNPNNKRYDRYGARGITICKEWENFEKFYEWCINNNYKDGLTIDRINNDGNYEPSNCRFATRKEQNRNYSRNHNITFNGETHCIKEWSEITGVKPATILYRLNSGKSLEKVFSTNDWRMK